MLTRIMTATLSGAEGKPVIVETDIHRGLPSLTLVGLADTTIKEACRRVRPAILNSGYDFPEGRVTVNLMPAGSPKEGSHFDLPMAIGIIRSGTVGKICGPADGVQGDTAFLGELSLDGRVNPVKGALPLVMCLRKAGIKNIVLPEANAREVSILSDVLIFPVKDLLQAAEYSLGRSEIKAYRADRIERHCRDAGKDFSQVIGQETAKRAVLIGAAGHHGILLMGGPGCGKTMIAGRIPTILPPLTYEEKLEITGIYSVAGLLDDRDPVICDRPFRSPHHTVSTAALIGGGRRPMPGEISLAHRGVLFLDEMGEFDIRSIDALRQPVEDGCVRIKRLAGEVVFPADVMIVAAANPCKCGYLWDDSRRCTCSKRQIDSYMRKLAGPFSDRIDIHVKMSRVPRDVLMAGQHKGQGYSSENMKKCVMKAVEAQRERYEGTDTVCNGGLDEDGIRTHCRLDADGERIMSGAYESMGLTVRAYDKLLKISRTIADLEGEERIRAEHVAEALIYRTDFSDVKHQAGM